MSAAAELLWTSRDQTTELRHLFENAPLGLAYCDRLGNISALNPALERMLSGKFEGGGPLRLGDLIQTREDCESSQLLSELFEGERESFQVDAKACIGGGHIQRWTVWRVPGTNGATDYALVLAKEVIENREIERRLHQAERLESVGRLAGGVAHDFNNVLTGVLLYCDLLMAGLEPGHRARKYAVEIRNAGLQASGLVRQLLAVARPSNCEVRLLSLNEIAEGMRNLLVRLLGENIELTLKLDPNLGLVKMDPTQAQQVLLNLALNARDAMPGGGRITVETSNTKVQVLIDQQVGQSRPLSVPCVLFAVTDNGSGMDEQTRAHLFEAFFTTKAAGKGTGLGLATVHDIVTSNGGLIHVDSTPARGTRVSVLLPLIPLESLNSQHSGHSSQKSNEGAFPVKEELIP